MFSKSVDHDGMLRDASSGPPIFAIIVAKMDFRDINTSYSKKHIAPISNMHKPTTEYIYSDTIPTV